MQQAKKENKEEHYCDGQQLPIDKYLQTGEGVGKYLLVVGESPAANGWRKSGRAFFTVDGKIVPTGKNLLINLKQIDNDLGLENISFTEIAKCFVADNRKILHACASKTWPHFIEQLNYMQPKLIVLLGQKTTEIFNLLASSSLAVGNIQEIELLGKKYTVLPIYHPSPLNPRRVQNVGFVDVNKEKIRKLLGIKTRD
ncbi:MAG: uracil-DNA glycosylase family protein [Candidatus Saccharibacteria bacterium]